MMAGSLLKTLQAQFCFYSSKQTADIPTRSSDIVLDGIFEYELIRKTPSEVKLDNIFADDNVTKQYVVLTFSQSWDSTAYANKQSQPQAGIARPNACGCTGSGDFPHLGKESKDNVIFPNAASCVCVLVPIAVSIFVPERIEE